MLKINSKKGQTAGLVTGIVFGIASLIIAVIIAFVIVSTLTDANLLQAQRTTSTVTNESGWLNATDYTLDEVLTSRLSYTLTAIWANETGLYDVSVPTANATVSAAGVVVTADADDYDDVVFTYTYVTKTNEELSAGALSTNFSSGVDNVSGKIPTILLVAAIVLILGVLVLLIGAWQRMRVGGGSI